jgi:transposase, IS5 family
MPEGPTGNPYDGHTLATLIPAIEGTPGANLARVVTSADDKGHRAPKEKRFNVSVAGQMRGLTATLKRASRRRAAVEPVIGHLKNEHRMTRNQLVGAADDASNAVLAAMRYTFRLLLKWLAFLCAFLRTRLIAIERHPSQPQPA